MSKTSQNPSTPMPLPTPPRRLRVASAVCLLAAGCVFPDERGDDLRVVLEPIPTLIEGEFHQVSARIVDPGGTTVPGADVAFASSNPLVALVGEDGLLLTIGVGTTDITASAVAFADAAPATQRVDVRNVLTVDSLSPDIVRFGDTLTIYGSGLSPEQPLLLVTVGGVETPIKRYEPEDPTAPNRFGALTVWIPPPATPIAKATILGLEGLAFSPDSVRVLQRDLYEPNDTLAWDFGVLDGRFVANPALAFEAKARDDSLRSDWYRFSTTAPGDWTILLQSPVIAPQLFQVFLTDSLGWNGAAKDYTIGRTAWTIGPGFYSCQGFPFTPSQLPRPASIFSLRNLPAGSYDVIAAYTLPGQYEFAIVPSHESVLPPDTEEENDYCNVAADLPFGVTRDLTIDNPNDIDWFRFTVGGAGLNVTFDVQADATEADLDLYILRDELPISLNTVASSKVGGTTDAVSVSLPAGNYFLVVVDFQGIPTTYALTTLSAVTPAPNTSIHAPAPDKPGTTPMLFRREPQ